MRKEHCLILVTTAASAVARGGTYSNHTSTPNCTGCSISENFGDIAWNSDVFNYTAATIILTIDNKTNTTETSTLPAATSLTDILYGLSIVDFLGTVEGSTTSTTVGGKMYTLTYPTSYTLVDAATSQTTFPVVKSDGQVACGTSVTTALPFIVAETGIPEVPGFNYSNCDRAADSPPGFLYRVSGLTGTSTRYGTAQQGSLPSSQAIPQPALKPVVNALVPSSLPAITSTGPTFLTSQPVLASLPPLPTSATPISHVANALDASGSDHEAASSATSGPSSVSASAASVIQNPIATPITTQASPEGIPQQNPTLPDITVASQIYHPTPIPHLTLVSEATSPPSSAPALPNESISLPPGSLTTITDNGDTIPSPPALLTLGSSKITPGASGGFNVNGQAYTASTDTGYIIGSQTLLPGGAAITLSGTPYSLAASASALVIGSSTITLASPSLPPAAYVTSGITIAPAAGTAGYVIDGATLSPGGPALTVDGQAISLPSGGGGNVVVGSTTEVISPSLGIGGAVVAGLGGAPGGGGNGTQGPGGGGAEAFTGDAAGILSRGSGWMGWVMGVVVATGFAIIDV